MHIVPCGESEEKEGMEGGSEEREGRTKTGRDKLEEEEKKGEGNQSL